MKQALIILALGLTVLSGMLWALSAAARIGQRMVEVLP